MAEFDNYRRRVSSEFERIDSGEFHSEILGVRRFPDQSFSPVVFLHAGVEKAQDISAEV